MNFLGHVIAWIIVTVCALIVGLLTVLFLPGIIESVLPYLEPDAMEAWEAGAKTWIRWLGGGFTFLCVMGLASDMQDRLAGKPTTADRLRAIREEWEED